MHKIFIDGQEGTTGLRIHEMLGGRNDIEVMTIPRKERKDPKAKKKFLNEADLVILCLPDDAARESESLVSNLKTRVIDTSTAHRISRGWVYGFAELDPKQRDKIRESKRVANPGCHATGFIALVFPLLSNGLIPTNYPITCQSLTGYSGGGKKLIGIYEDYQGKSRDPMCVRPYALSLKHKHVPEMQQITGLVHPPLFTPVVGDFYSGMLVSIPLFPRLLSRRVDAKAVHAVLAEHYENQPFVRVAPFGSETALEEGFLSATACNETNRMDLFVFGHAGQILLTARLDNLGKGASGAAVQNMNLMLGLEETAGLIR